MRFVIIGNSAAGVNAAQELRAADKDSQITIVSSEKDMAYSRCLISRFLDGRLKADGLYFKTRNFYHNYNVKPLLGKTALSLDRSAKEVILASGERLAYDKLLLAVGAGPIRKAHKALFPLAEDSAGNDRYRCATCKCRWSVGRLGWTRLID